MYDDNKQNASYITLSKVGKPPVSLLTRDGLGQPTPANSRVSFRPNAGMTLKHVTPEDAGSYRSTVYFSNENNSKNLTLVDEALLNVYSSRSNIITAQTVLLKYVTHYYSNRSIIINYY